MAKPVSHKCSKVRRPISAPCCRKNSPKRRRRDGWPQRIVRTASLDDARNSAEGRSATTRPASRSTTRSARYSASSRSWVTISVVTPNPPQQLPQHGLDLCAGQRVERAKRLIHQQHNRINHQRARHPCSLLLGRHSTSTDSYRQSPLAEGRPCPAPPRRAPSGFVHPALLTYGPGRAAAPRFR